MPHSEYPGLGSRIHFDNATVHPLHRDVLRAITDSHMLVGVPGKASYQAARHANENLAQARQQIARFIGADEDEVFFVASASEAVKGLLRLYRGPIGRVVYSHEDHLSVVRAVRVQTPHAETMQLAYSESGLYLPYSLQQDDLVLATLVHPIYGVQNDVPAPRPGTATVLLDISQAVGRVPVAVHAWNVAAAYFSGQKIGGMTGCGVVYVAREFQHLFQPLLALQPNTLPLAAITSLAAAIQVHAQLATAGALIKLSERLVTGLSAIHGVRFAKGIGVNSLSCDGTGIVSFAVDGYSSQDIAMLCDDAGINVRAGDHCVDPRYAQQDMVRVSLAHYNTVQEIDEFLHVIRNL